MDIERWLATHDGVASRAQARACGLSEDTIARKVASGEWLRRAPAVYFAVAWTWTPAARVRVAAEWVRPVGALASVTAARWLGLGVASPHPLTVALPRGCSRRVPPGIVVWQRHPGPDRQDHRGLPVVGTALAVLDTAVALGREGPAFLDRGGTAARAGRRPGRVRARASPAGAAARRRRDRLVGQPRGHPVRRSAHPARRGVPRPPVRHRG